MTRLESLKKACKRYKELTAEISPLEAEKKSLKKTIDGYTGGQTTEAGRYTVVYTEVRGGIDLEALIAEHPEIDIERYRKAPTTRISVKEA